MDWHGGSCTPLRLGRGGIQGHSLTARACAQIELLNRLQLLSAKPMIYLVNMTERDYIRQRNKWCALHPLRGCTRAPAGRHPSHRLPRIQEWIDARGNGETLIPVSCAFERAVRARRNPHAAARNTLPLTARDRPCRCWTSPRRHASGTPAGACSVGRRAQLTPPLWLISFQEERGAKTALPRVILAGYKQLRVRPRCCTRWCPPPLLTQPRARSWCTSSRWARMR